MHDDDEVPTYHSSASAARLIGITRAGVYDAVERGRLVPDAYAGDDAGRKAPLFREETVNAYKHGRYKRHA